MPANKLVKLRPISAATSTPDAGTAAAQQNVLPVTGLTDGSGIAIDASENIYIVDCDLHVIFKYRRGEATSKVFAGASGQAGLADGQGSAARFSAPTHVACDRRGTLWVVDSGNNRVRRIDENGNVYTVCTIPAEVGGDRVGGICVDSGDNIYLLTNDQ